MIYIEHRNLRFTKPHTTIYLETRLKHRVPVYNIPFYPLTARRVQYRPQYKERMAEQRTPRNVRPYREIYGISNKRPFGRSFPSATGFRE